MWNKARVGTVFATSMLSVPLSWMRRQGPTAIFAWLRAPWLFPSCRGSAFRLCRGLRFQHRLHHRHVGSNTVVATVSVGPGPGESRNGWRRPCESQDP